MLNHHVGGSDALKENLVPIRGPYNSQMERDFESIVKNRVLGNREILHYRVEAIFGGQPGRANLPEESDLPTALTFTMKSMQKKDATVSGLEPDHWEDVPGAPNLYAAANPFVHNLEADTPPSVLPTISLADLRTEAGTSALSFSAFRSQNAIHIRSVDGLLPPDKTALEKIFTDRELLAAKTAELARITPGMSTAAHITSWSAFTVGKSFYTPPASDVDAVAAANYVKGEFERVQGQLRSSAITAARGVANQAAAGAFAGQNWIDFKVANKINFRAEPAEVPLISAIETIFRSKQ